MQFWSLHTQTSPYTPYESVRELQLKLVEMRAKDEIPDTVLFLEHEPVVTRGKGLQFTGEPGPRHMPMLPLPPEVVFAESERGGDLTYHGPGQLVIYPICKLVERDVGAFLRKMEAILIAELNDRLASTGARCEGVENATGVWIRAKDEPRASKKIASMGIAVRKWVTYHGLALNCVNDLRSFQLISPCGFAPEVMTRLQDWTSLDIKSWRVGLENALARRMSELAGELPAKVESRVV